MDAAFLQNASVARWQTRGSTPGWYAVPRWGTPDQRPGPQNIQPIFMSMAQEAAPRQFHRSTGLGSSASGAHRTSPGAGADPSGMFLVPPSQGPHPSSGGHSAGRGASAGIRRSPRLVGGSGVAQMPLTALQKGILAVLAGLRSQGKPLRRHRENPRLGAVMGSCLRSANRRRRRCAPSWR